MNGAEPTFVLAALLDRRGKIDNDIQRTEKQIAELQERMRI